MSEKYVYSLVLIFVLVGMFGLVSTVPVQGIETTGPIYIRADGSVDPPSAPIQRNGDSYILTSDINSSTSGIVIQRNNMTLDGANHTIQFDGPPGSSGGKGVDITGVSNVNVTNTRIRLKFLVGIALSSSSECWIAGNDILETHTAIEVAGDSNHNTISGNAVENTYWGIRCSDYGLGNGLFGNTVMANSNTGIQLGPTSSPSPPVMPHMLRDNSLAENGANLVIVANSMSPSASDFVHDIDSSNTVDGKPVYYWVNQQNAEVPPGAGFVALINCSQVIVKDQNLTNSQGLLVVSTNDSVLVRNRIGGGVSAYGWMWGGIELYWSLNITVSDSDIGGCGFGILCHNVQNCTFSNNTLLTNKGGIGIYDGSGCTLSENLIVHDWAGVYLSGLNCTVSRNQITTYTSGSLGGYSGLDVRGSFNEVFENTFRAFLPQGGPSPRNIVISNSSNKVYHNNFMGTVAGGAGAVQPNVWDDGYPSGGNYWNNLRAFDEKSGPGQDEAGSDGIVDVPCVCYNENNTDRYPLAVPWGPVSEYHSGTWEESPNFTPLGWRNITYIVVHVMDGSIESAVNWFKNPDSDVSAHYLISQEGEVIQMVREKDIAWHAGNWTYNQQSIGIEHEDKGNWNTPNWVPIELYQTSATLVRSLCDKYGIPKDREHIIGHNEVPGVTKPCPGPYWDWDYFIGLVNGILAPRTFVARLEGIDYAVSVLSNSTAFDFIFSQQLPEQMLPGISINFTAPSGTHAFCNLTIPKNFMKGDAWWVIFVNDFPLIWDAKTENTTHTFLSFTFTHSSTVNVKVWGSWVVSEFPSFLVLQSFMMATLLAVIVYRRKRSSKREA